MRLGPGEVKRINATVEVLHAGVNYVLLMVNGTPVQFPVEVLFYTPVLVAEPVTVRTYKLPAVVALNVTVRNIGNYTGYIAGAAVPPGGNATVETSLNITAAGRYYVNIDGVKAEVDVIYLATGYSVSIWSPAVEATPGEGIPVSFLLRNTGNATETLVVNGTVYTIGPGGSIWANFTVPAYAHRQVSLSVNGTTYRWTLNVTAIGITVLFYIGGRLYNPSLSPSIVVSTSQAQMSYQWIVKTNATTRSVAVVANGSTYVIPSGGEAIINGTLQARLNGWNSASITINGTMYSIQIYAQLVAPTINVASIYRIDFVDDRPYEAQVTCNTPGGAVTVTVKIYNMQGSVTYSGGAISFSGTFTVYLSYPGNTYTGTFSGSSNGGSGQVTITVAGHTATVQFSGGSVTTKLQYDGVSCPQFMPVPPFMYQSPPTGSIPADRLGVQLANLFAKSSSDYIVDSEYNGQYVVMTDAAGHTIRFYFNGGLSTSGPLQLTVYGQIS
ncbi:MAG: hypothetical protein QXP98_11050 [Thermoproteus sp.]